MSNNNINDVTTIDNINDVTTIDNINDVITIDNIKDDVTTPEGRANALEAVSLRGTLQWTAMPCTGGSPWQRLNRKRPGMAQKLEEHWKTFRAIWASFVLVADRCLQAGGIVALEWAQWVRVLEVA